MGFTKLDENIVQSSIMAEDDCTFKIWIAFLATCDNDGVSRVSPIYLSSVCRKTIEETMVSVNKLLSPDPYSRTPEKEGRRIERVDGGYRIVNYLKYREYLYSDSPEAIKKRKQRGHNGTCPQMSPNGGDISASASSSLKDLNTDQEGDCKGETNFFFLSWNEFAPKYGLAKIKELSKSRLDKINVRKVSEDTFKKILSGIAEQSFLHGDNDRGWKVDFDWIFENDKNHLKILEGKYRKETKTIKGDPSLVGTEYEGMTSGEASDAIRKKYGR